MAECAFCGGAALSREHVFPRWLEQFLGTREQILEQDRYGENPFSVRRRADGLDFTVRRVCRGCNGGWMSDIEARGRPLLEPFITSLRGKLVDPATQRGFALWAVKTAMVFDLTQAAPLARAEDRKALARGRIPGHAHVWVGACEAYLPLTMGHTIRLDIEPHDELVIRPPAGLVVTIKLGHLCFVVGLPGLAVRWQSEVLGFRALQSVWPRRRRTIAWPWARIPDAAAFDELGSLFVDASRMAHP